jgi:hypothetical protein
MIEEQLGPQEQLLWAGRPPAGLLLRPAEAFLIPFSLLWCGFAIFWECAAITQIADPLFVLFGIPFVLMGLYIVFGRFVYDIKEREHTFYGLTNERVLIVSGIVRRTVKSLNLRTLSDVSMTERPDGSGTITFGHGSFFPWSFQSAGWPGIKTVPSSNGSRTSRKCTTCSAKRSESPPESRLGRDEVFSFRPSIYHVTELSLNPSRWVRAMASLPRKRL